MARAREFDEVTAPEAEIECFWHRGDEAASVRHLADKMGISEPSLYNAYGDKRALFAQALDHHVDHSARALIKRLESSLPPKQAVRRFIEEIVERSVNDRERAGLFSDQLGARGGAARQATGRPHRRPPRRGRGGFLPIDQSGASRRSHPSGSRRKRISRACCSAFCSAFEFSPVQSPSGPCSRASRALRSPF